jgi:predicted MFS family arabinose efflux permease
VTSEPALYTREFLRACLMHLTGGMSLSLFLLFPLFVKSLGGCEATIGFLLGVGAAASVAVRPAVGVLLDRVPRRPVLVWLGVANVVSWAPFLLLTGVGPALWVCTVFHDVVWGALFAAYFTYAADLAPPLRRAEAIAMFGVAGMTANGLAPIIGERVIDAGGYGAYFALAMALGLVSVAISSWVPRTPMPVHHEHPPALRDALRLLRRRGIATVMVVTALLGIAINAGYIFVAPFTRVVGLARAAPFFAAYSATSVVIRLFGRRTLDLMGPHRVSVPAFLAYGAALVGLSALPHAEGEMATLVLVLSGIGCGLGHGSLFPVLNALALSRAPAGRQGAVVGLHTAAIDAGAVLGMPLCGVLAEAYGYPVMFSTMALACVAGIGLMAGDARRAGRGMR